MLEQGKYEHAIRLFDKVLAIDPQIYLAMCDKGVALKKLGRKKEALKCFNHVIQ